MHILAHAIAASDLSMPDLSSRDALQFIPLPIESAMNDRWFRCGRWDVRNLAKRLGNDDKSSEGFIPNDSENRV